jgi:hypothetical protein
MPTIEVSEAELPRVEALLKVLRATPAQRMAQAAKQDIERAATLLVKPAVKAEYDKLTAAAVER